MAIDPTADGLLVLTEEDSVVLDERDFGMPGLVAREWLGPFVPLQASGPIITVHDSVIEPHMGIGHHPHRFNERLFYILSGTLDHDDALNNITGHMGTHDLGRLTEGRTGMYHKEWNNSDERCRAFILVYRTEPVPLHASFAALRDAEAPRYDEAPGVRTKELVGGSSPLQIHGDIRLYTDSTFESGARLEIKIGRDEAAMLFPLDGSFVVDDVKLSAGQALVVPPEERHIPVEAISPGRLLRGIHGAGQGLEFGDPYARRS